MLPREAENEVVNAVDHRPTPAITAEAESLHDNPTNAPSAKEVEHTSGWLKTSGAGALHCIEHQIIETMQLIRALQSLLGGLEVRAKLQARADAVKFNFAISTKSRNTERRRQWHSVAVKYQRKLAALSGIQPLYATRMGHESDRQACCASGEIELRRSDRAGRSSGSLPDPQVLRLPCAARRFTAEYCSSAPRARQVARPRSNSKPLGHLRNDQSSPVFRTFLKNSSSRRA